MLLLLPLQRAAFPALLSLALPALWAASVSAQDAAESTEGALDFGRNVQPILARHCYSCHGPEKQMAGLRLDQKAAALAGGDSGPVIEAGNGEESELVYRVSTDDEFDRMPPDDADALTAEEIEVLRVWIDQGAEWTDEADADSARRTSDHWAFQTPVRPEFPELNTPDWVRNPIDAFVLAKLEAEGIEPSPEADRVTLIRRLSFDLLGLPPTLEAIDAFVNDPSPNAYESLVDRLLASPAFGERWGRHWLDLARYADSDGYEKDQPRPFAYRYRDWVIDAINRDLPFDQFTIEQLAGDLLPEPTLDQKIATGFHRNTLTNTEGGVDQEEFRVAAVMDRVNTTGTIWLGLTVACAQCHTHKYDPILQREYYELFAFFNSADEADLNAPTDPEQAAYEAAKATFEAEKATLKTELDRFVSEELPQRQSDWERSATIDPIHWVPLQVVEAASSNGATLSVQADGSIRVEGESPDTDTYTIVGETPLAGITAIRLEALDDPELPSNGPGRAPHGNFVLSNVQVSATERYATDEPVEVGLLNPTADHSQDSFDIAGAIDGDPKTGWAVKPHYGQAHVAVFETEQDIGLDCGTRFTITLDQQYGRQHTLGKFRLSVTSAPRPVGADSMSEAIAEILRLAVEDRSEAQQEQLATYYRSIDPKFNELTQVLAKHEQDAPQPPDSKVMTLVQRDEPRTTHMFVRGDFLRPAEEVTAGTPEVLHPLTREPAEPTRLDLAHWLMDPANPLTARVAVNRVWRHLFGRPLVASVEDFGTRGEVPTHPELLDWLATEYPQLGWSRKALIKTIVMSSTYRQSSVHRPELHDRDPLNTWLARQNRFRLEAEIVRDVALATSGLLAARVGGPSVRPPQPPGISELTYAGSANWVESTGPDRYRRGLYTWLQRTSPYPMLLTFDAPDGNVCDAQRERSNTPLQALTLLNDAVFVECAQALGARILSDVPTADPEARIWHGFRLCVGRAPDDAELAILTKLHDELLAECRDSAEETAELVEPSTPEAATWTALARTILNLDEAMSRE